MITLLRGLFRCVRSWERRRVRRVEKEEEGERCGRKKGWEKRGREGKKGAIASVFELDQLQRKLV